jgi:branched-chain amino acid transport system permease protein
VDVLLQSLFSGLATGSVLAIVGLGFVVVHRVTSVVNFAQGAFAVSGAFLMSSLVGGLPWPVALAVAVVAGGALAALVGLVVVAGRGSHGVSALIVTLGAALALEGVYVLVWGDLPISYDPVARRALAVGGAFLLPQQVATMASLVVVFVALHAFLAYSYLGKALTAAALNPAAARLVGVNLRTVGVVAFAVSGIVSAVAGALVAPLNPVTPATHLTLAVGGFTAAIVGNLYSAPATVVGGLALGVLQALAANLGADRYQQEVGLVALLVVLLVQAARRRSR